MNIKWQKNNLSRCPKLLDHYTNVTRRRRRAEEGGAGVTPMLFKTASRAHDRGQGSRSGKRLARNPWRSELDQPDDRHALVRDDHLPISMNARQQQAPGIEAGDRAASESAYLAHEWWSTAPASAAV